MNRPSFKYKKDLIFENKTNQYIVRYINCDNEIIDFKINNDEKCFMNIVKYYRKIDEKSKLDFIRHVNFQLLPHGQLPLPNGV
jgi:hypothetical protein